MKWQVSCYSSVGSSSERWRVDELVECITSYTEQALGNAEGKWKCCTCIAILTVNLPTALIWRGYADDRLLSGKYRQKKILFQVFLRFKILPIEKECFS